MATVIKAATGSSKAILASLQAQRRGRFLDAAARGKDLANKKDKMELAFLGASLKSMADIDASNVNIADSRDRILSIEAAVAENTKRSRESKIHRDALGDTAPLSRRARTVEDTADGDKDEDQRSDFPVGDDNTLIIESLTGLKPGDLRNDALVSVLERNIQAALGKLQDESIKTATEQLRVGRSLAGSDAGVKFARDNLAPDSFVLKAVEEEVQRVRDLPSRLQGAQDQRTLSAADRGIRELDLDKPERGGISSEQQDVDIINDPTAKKSAKEVAQGRLDKRSEFERVFEGFGVSRTGRSQVSVSSELETAIGSQPEASTEPSKRTKAIGVRRVREALRKPSAMALISGAKKISDLSDKIVSGLFGIVLADGGITMSRVEFEKILQQHLDTINIKPGDFKKPFDFNSDIRKSFKGRAIEERLEAFTSKQPRQPQQQLRRPTAIGIPR